MSSTVVLNQRIAGVQSVRAKGPPVWPSNTKSKAKQGEEHAFETQAFLDSASLAGKTVVYRNNVAVFTQGDPATSVLYIRKGAVKITVVNEAGKEAVIAILGTGNFLGEGCLAGQSRRVNTAETITRSTILRIDKLEMIRAIHEQHEVSDQFITYMVARNVRAEEDLVNQLFNSSEKRLARTLLLLTRNGNQQGEAETAASNISQEMLAEMVGTTRSRVNVFMNKFRELGFIEYGIKLRGLLINKSLLNTFLRD